MQRVWEYPCCCSLVLVLRSTISPSISSTYTQHSVIPYFPALSLMANMAQPANESEIFDTGSFIWSLLPLTNREWAMPASVQVLQTERIACYPTLYNEICIRLSYNTSSTLEALDGAAAVSVEKLMSPSVPNGFLMSWCTLG